MTDCKGERKRAYAPKTRSGCRTCKQRHKKCDEGRPFCKRCTSSGRKCSYEAPPRSLIQARPVAIISKVSFTTVVGNAKDDFHLGTFSRIIAPKIAGFYDDPDFWKGTVVQLGHKEPAIRLAIQAVTALHAEVEKLEGCRIKKIDPAILKDYNNAIRHLVQGGSSPLYVKAVIVALFVCIEFLTENEENAVIHINGGLKLLQDWKDRSAASSPESESSESSNESSPIASTSSENELVDELSSTFSRLSVHSKLFNKQMFTSRLPSDIEFGQSTFNFENMAQARNEGFKIVSDSLSFISRATPLSYSEEGANDIFYEEQQNVVARIREWRRAFKEFARRRGMMLSPMQVRGGNMLLCHNICCEIWVGTALRPYEEECDKYTAEFQEVIDLAQTIVEVPEEFLRDNLGRFQLDIALIPTLHFVGTRCRIPSIRKAAVEMLTSRRWREGLNDSFQTAKVIELYTKIEETRKKELMGLNDSELPDYLPCEGARVHFMWADELKDDDGHGSVVYSFFTKPYGAFGDWYVQECRVPSNPAIVLTDCPPTKVRPVPNSAYRMPSVYSRLAEWRGNFPVECPGAPG